MIEEKTKFELEKASLTRRSIALIIDFWSFIIIWLCVMPIVLRPIQIAVKNNSIFFYISSVLILSSLFLFLLKDNIRGSSLGKWLFGIMVRDESAPDEIPSFKRLLLRNLFLLIMPVELIILIKNDDKKRLGDRFANTIVVKNPIKTSRLKRIMVFIGILIFITGLVIFTEKNDPKSRRLNGVQPAKPTAIEKTYQNMNGLNT